MHTNPGFGYKCAWLAIRSTQPEAVAAALGLSDVRPSTWAAGIATASRPAWGQRTAPVFVTPPLDGWILCCGCGLLPYLQGAASSLVGLLTHVSTTLDTEVQYFGTHRVIEAHGWARALPTGIVRAYAYLGESGVTCYDLGEMDDMERTLRREFAMEMGDEEEGEAEYVPDEAHVMRMAAAWSLDPTTLSAAQIDTGLLGICTLPESDAASAATPTSSTKAWWQFWKR